MSAPRHPTTTDTIMDRLVEDPEFKQFLLSKMKALAI
jgi:hypothetical protein